MKKITILGAGIVGSAIAKDLCSDFSVTSIDRDTSHLNTLKDEFSINIQEADLSYTKNIKEFINDCDLVINALPGHLGFQAMKTVIESKKNTVDIAFYSEDPFELDELARKNQVTAVMDCGVAPGMSNMIAGYHNEKMEVQSFECLVGGLPMQRNWPYEYKAPFSPIDVLEEYTRPSRIMENGKVIIKPALSEPELVDFEEIGTLESFNTDGLRTLLKTMKIPDMKEKTLRYPGHIELMRVFRESGFFSKKPININDTEISPLEFTTKLLFPLWKYEEDEEEFTIMRISIKGIKNGKKEQVKYTLFDVFDNKTKISSMARTTGYPCCATARLILNGTYNRKGVSPPEYVGENEECFYYILDYLEKRGVKFIRKGQSD